MIEERIDRGFVIGTKLSPIEKKMVIWTYEMYRRAYKSMAARNAAL